MVSAIDTARLAINMAPMLAPKMAGGALAKMLEVAIEGYDKAKLPSAKETAKSALKSRKDPENAIASIVNQHLAMAATQGFLTNLGGALTAIVTIPANMASVGVVQCRMVAAIAHLRGYDIDDNRTRSAILMCLLGKSHNEELIRQGQLPSTPLAVATAPVFDELLDDRIATFVMNDVLAAVGGKRMGVMLAKRIPLLGGGVGAVVDSVTTRSVAKYALEQFPSRRKMINQ